MSQASLTASSSPSRPSTGSSSMLLHSASRPQHAPTLSSSSSINPRNGLLAPSTPSHNNASLSPVANRMRERDADAMEKYLLRNRSGSGSTTDNRSINGSTNESTQASMISPSQEEFHPIPDYLSGSVTPRRLRPSFSAAQLRTPHDSSASASNHSTPHAENRNRSGTNPSTHGAISPLPLSRSSSISNSIRSIISPDRATYEEPQTFIGPPSQYAQFPEPPAGPANAPTGHSSRRKALQILGKPLSGFDSSGSSHRRGMSATSVRGVS